MPSTSPDSGSDSESLALDAVFTEPPRPPSPAPTVATYTRTRAPFADGNAEENKPREGSEASDGWTTIELRLVGSHPLWAHHLWNAARAFATYLDRRVHLYRGKNVLELGAGGGLPGLVTALNGAGKTVLTDYPDAILLENLAYNVARNVPESLRAGVDVQGYLWGAPVASLLEVAPGGFDVIILSDLVFNHSQHDALLKTCELALRRTDASKMENQGATRLDSVRPDEDDEGAPAVLVFYTHHRPHLATRDLDFFAKARAWGWACAEVVTVHYPPMFPDDPGEEEVRATVHGWRLTRLPRRREGQGK
ncbi:nicotinamide N-methyltransferase [Phellopilus nigrolimitatus]|nr:nicotinamide N-methyltransferase [Phellopilus nigrolimitatus]